MNVTIITLFPALYPGPLGQSLVGKALDNNKWSLRVIDLRTHGLGPHACVDDACYGGGPGMVIRPDVVDAAIKQSIGELVNPRFIYMTPRGVPMAQALLTQYAASDQEMVILCGRYEGVDQRVLDFWHFEEVSLGDFVLCGGDIPAMALIEGCVRLLPGVVHNPESTLRESFQTPMLEHPQYTRPQEWRGLPVPDVLVSGHHGKIRAWQETRALQDTQKRRPDLVQRGE
jgi:tRNA (guanine37-N1)-methyltransferase